MADRLFTISRALGVAILAGAAGGAGGCLSGHTYVLEKPSVSPVEARYGTVSVREVESSTTIEGEQREHFRSALIDALTPAAPDAAANVTADAGSTSGTGGAGGAGGAGRSENFSPDSPPLVLEYRFVLHESGSGPVRIGAFLVSLFGVPVNALGTGAVGVEATFYDVQGRRLAHIVVDGPIDGPGGSTDSGLATAAEQISRFTHETFGANVEPPTVGVSP